MYNNNSTTTFHHKTNSISYPFEADPYLSAAGQILIEHGRGSIGTIQRYLKIGFNRAARIMDQLEEIGVVGPDCETKPRKILMTIEEFNDYIENFDYRENTTTSDCYPATPPIANESANNIPLEESILQQQFNISADFTSDGALLNNMQNSFIYNCSEKVQHEMIDCLISSNSSNTMRLIIFDKNNLSYFSYEDLPQLFIPVVSDDVKLSTVFDWLMKEMSERLHTFAAHKLKNYNDFNKNGFEYFPAIVFIVSEFHLVENYFSNNNTILQLLMHGNNAGIYFLFFSQFETKHLSIDLLEDLVHTYTPSQAKQILLNSVENSSNNLLDLNSIDDMDGKQFENYCISLLQQNGFSKIETTQAYGNHGIDILAEKDDITYAILCKCSSANIGNSIIQQVYTGKSIYHKDIAVVITNQFFTQQAIDDSTILGVKLWDRNKLETMRSLIS
jgi:hypothetical protein